MRFNDSVIAHIAKLLQLTGTDIVDHLRMIRLRVAQEEGEINDELFLTANYEENSEKNIARMLTEITDLTGAEAEA
jgi:hypothetical protein